LELNFIRMNIKNQLQSRRNFLKGAVINGAALSALPATALATSKSSDEKQIDDEDKIPRLPLKIYLSSGIEEQFREYIRSLSDKITLIDRLEDNELQTEIPNIDVWFGYISKEQFLHR